MKSLSVVMPVQNEAPYLASTIDALAAAVAQSDFDTELIVVDDGSTDGSDAVVEAARPPSLRTRLIREAHAGRFRARMTGLDAADGDWVLLLDARVRLGRGSLRYLAARIADTASVWNGHVDVDTRGNPFGAFGNVLVHIGWRRYFADPRATSYGADDFDHYPKGTGCFLAPRRLLLEAMEAFSPRVSDWRYVSDDTQLIRWIAERHRIHLSPDFRCDYQPRTSLRAFLRNGLYRGSTFLDGHGRRESRFFPVVVAFYPVSVALAALVVRRPLLLPALFVGTAAAAAAAAARARRPGFETASFAALAPVYAIAHGAGMWRALGVMARERLRHIRPT
jgi:glycosyltransferase involved in cell wall biosynthesis